jgi:plastocyanin
VQFAGLEAGSYEVEVDVPEGHELEEGQSARRTVTAVAGSTAQAEFRLTSGAPVVEIRLTSNLRFEPSEVTISPGTVVRWVNETSMLHTITPDGHGEWERAELSSPEEMFAHAFTESGEFPYFCEPHVDFGMMGSITVQ